MTVLTKQISNYKKLIVKLIDCSCQKFTSDNLLLTCALLFSFRLKRPKSIVMSSTNWSTVFKYDTEFSADSVEWCPISPYHNYFLCGTYLLLENDCPQQERIGSLLLMKADRQKLDLLDKVNTYGILDCKWAPIPIYSQILCAIVTAVGEIAIYCLEAEKIVPKTVTNLKDNETGDYIVLAVNWCCNNSETKVCVTDNKGNAAILKLSSERLEIVSKWQAHNCEAWTIAFSSEETLYTGGDDAKLRVWDLRSSCSSQVASLSSQDTGVTIICTDTKKDNIILTGSFDEIVLFWDQRKFKTPINQIKASGGLWRLKCISDYALTANIYGGFQILDISNVNFVSDYKEHSSLAYGADWSLLDSKEVSDMFNVSAKAKLLATCSFYDHLLTVSVWDPEK